MVKRVLARHYPKQLHSAECIQNGLIGLWSAAKHYRSDGGAKFSTYAWVCVRHAIAGALKKEGVYGQKKYFYPQFTHCTMTASDVEFQFDFSRFLSGLDARTQRIIEMLAAGHTRAEVAVEIGVSPSRVSQIMDAAKTKWSEYLKGDFV